MRASDFMICVAIQTLVPVLAWIVGSVFSASRSTQVASSFLWTGLGTFALIRIADHLQDSSVYQPPRPWDHIMQEGGIIACTVLVPVFACIAFGVTLYPLKRENS
jgi:hypothetical protein